jgi:chaperonin GroEL
MNIVYSACEAPFHAIIKNAGLPDSLVVDANKIDKVNHGYDVISEKFCDLIEVGVVDPTKVTRTALEKAVSVAGTLLTTECMVVNEPSDEDKK